jgi:hypothetical protein
MYIEQIYVKSHFHFKGVKLGTRIFYCNELQRVVLYGEYCRQVQYIHNTHDEAYCTTQISRVLRAQGHCPSGRFSSLGVVELSYVTLKWSNCGLCHSNRNNYIALIKMLAFPFLTCDRS